MMLDVLKLANPHLDILGKDGNGEIIKMSQACRDVAHFSKLSDDFILRSIQHSSLPELEEARSLVRRITVRNLYRVVGDVVTTSGEGRDVRVVEQQLHTLLRDEKEKGVPINLREEDIVVTKIKINLGVGGVQNPVEKVIFFDKRNRPITILSDELHHRPVVTNSETLLVMCRRSKEDHIAISDATDLFNKWCKGPVKTVGGDNI